ncbi:putative disease resistance protein RGA4 [Curcuma longa]|uniref:putative disease resistance protein RGA4 n=1 Tax=Curcuma longa TaxID=136217 RepID=UPI003D9EAA37
MEVALASSAARFLGQRVADLLQLDKKLKELTDIKGKMEKLKELSTIIDMVIKDVEPACSMRDDAVKKLLRKLKHLAYDLEDAVDYYDTEALRKQRSRAYSRPVRDFFSSNNNQLVFKSRIGGMIKAVMESLNSILLQKSILENLPQGTVRMSPSAYREIHSHNSLAVLGRELEKEMIVNMLTDDEGSSNDTMKVIAIVGMGGLGKTTLARHVFNDERVKAYFENFSMWKVVGAEFDPTKIMKSVLELTTGAPVNISEPELVRGELKKVLSEKRFLLVLDDVWNEDQLQWRALKAALTCGARGSKVLVTTRNREVSSIMGSVKTHQIQQLSREDCLSLFQQFAFGDTEPNKNLMKIGGKIVEKCGGVPLAAVSLGSTLNSTRDETYWSAVLNSEVWQLRDEDQKFLAVLKLSYDSLPPPSKKCFVFGSLFPKNYPMEKDQLIQLWIANGFICSEGNFDAETIGNHIFDDLVLRSFFLSTPSENCDDDGHHVTKCTMHDLMHDLARSVSDDEYYTLEDYKAKKDIQKRTYHMSINYENLSNTSQVIFKKSMCLRTLLMTYCGFYQKAWKQFQLIFSELKFLRVLNLRYNGIKEVPTSVGNLIHLRYLDLSDNEIEVLPDTITLLQKLQYLNLQGNQNLQELPKKLRNMQSLHLQSLSCFVAGNKTGSCSITELEDLKLHGEMQISFSENYRNYSCGGRKILKNKDFNELFLFFNNSDTYDISMLDDLCPNMSLKKLKISNYGSQQFPTWLIESQLPNLVELNLEKMPKLEEWSESDGVDELFPSLKRLEICNCPKLKNMPRLPRIEFLKLHDCSENLLSGIGRMTSLSHLILEDMKGMTSLPTGCLRNLTSLMTLDIRRCNELQFLPCDEMQLLTMVQSLTIEECDNLASFPLEVGRLGSLRYLCFKNHNSNTLQLEIPVQILNSLHEFDIQICGKIVNLCGQLQHLHMLRQLRICGSHQFSYESPYKLAKLSICCCDELESLMTAAPSTSVLEDLDICDISNLTTLPKWLQHLISLRALRIYNCPELRSLPRVLRDLRSLKVLFINECRPQLKRRCQRETGKDWQNISHVPHIDISLRGTTEIS